MPSRNAFVCGNPQTKTTTLRIIQGSQARRISDFELRISNLKSGSDFGRLLALCSRTLLCLASLSFSSPGKAPDAFRLPDFQEERQRRNRNNRRHDIHQPRAVKVRHQELRNREEHAGDQDCGPDFQHAAETGERPDQPERNDERKERKLPSDHRAQFFEVQSGHALQTDQRRAQCAERLPARCWQSKTDPKPTAA